MEDRTGTGKGVKRKSEAERKNLTAIVVGTFSNFLNYSPSERPKDIFFFTGEFDNEQTPRNWTFRFSSSFFIVNVNQTFPQRMLITKIQLYKKIPSAAFQNHFAVPKKFNRKDQIKPFTNK